MSELDESYYKNRDLILDYSRKLIKRVLMDSFALHPFYIDYIILPAMEAIRFEVNNVPCFGLIQKKLSISNKTELYSYCFELVKSYCMYLGIYNSELLLQTHKEQWTNEDD